MLVLSYSQWCPPSFFHITHALSFGWGAKLCLKLLSGAQLLFFCKFLSGTGNRRKDYFFQFWALQFWTKGPCVTVFLCILELPVILSSHGSHSPRKLRQIALRTCDCATGFANGTDRSGPAKSIETDLCTWCTPEKIDGFCTMTAKTKVFVL